MAAVPRSAFEAFHIAARRSKYGDETARQYAMMNLAGLKYIEDLVKLHAIDCAFEWYPAVCYTRACNPVRYMGWDSFAGFRLPRPQLPNSLPVEVQNLGLNSAVTHVQHIMRFAHVICVAFE
jgi:hypothetical protein